MSVTFTYAQEATKDFSMTLQSAFQNTVTYMQRENYKVKQLHTCFLLPVYIFQDIHAHLHKHGNTHFPTRLGIMIPY